MIRKIFLGKQDALSIQFIRYFFVGGFAFIIDFGLLYILTDIFSIHYFLSAAISFTIGLLVNYLLSTQWVFSKRSINNKQLEISIFFIIGAIGLGLNQFFIWLFTEAAGTHYLVSKLLSGVIVLLWNFFARKFTLFR